MKRYYPWVNMYEDIEFEEDSEDGKWVQYEDVKELLQLHNLLPFIASGKCECDSSVGMVPCMTCAAKEILQKAGIKVENNKPE